MSLKPKAWGEPSKDKLEEVKTIQKKKKRIYSSNFTPNLVPFIKYSLAFIFIVGVGYLIYRIIISFLVDSFISNIDSSYSGLLNLLLWAIIFIFPMYLIIRAISPGRGEWY